MKFIILTAFLFSYTGVNGQLYKSTYVHFGSTHGNSYLNNGATVDSCFYVRHPDKHKKVLETSKNDKIVTYEYDEDIYQYHLKENIVQFEKVYIGSEKKKLFREKRYRYKEGTLIKIIVSFNVCCDNEGTLPADYVYFIYDKNRLLLFAVAAIDKKVPHSDEKNAFGTEINRDNFSVSNIYKFEYDDHGVSVFSCVVKNIALKTRNINRLKKRYSVEGVTAHRFISNDNMLLKYTMRDIMFPIFYLSLYGYNGYYISNE